MFHAAIFSPCRSYRYCLYRKWSMVSDDDARLVLWVMLNPSLADEIRSDRTIDRCINFSKVWGYDGLMIGNAYALRSPYPEDLWKVADPVGPENDSYITKMAQRAQLIVVGWGGNAVPDRAQAVGEILTRHQPVHCLAINQDGSPKHPLYVKGDCTPRAFI